MLFLYKITALIDCSRGVERKSIDGIEFIVDIKDNCQDSLFLAIVSKVGTQYSDYRGQRQ